MKSIRIGKTALVAAAVTLTASLSVGSALAYFTTYCTAEGAYQMSMGFPETDIDEDVIDGSKHVKIVNTGQYDCFVRVKAFAPDYVSLEYTGGASENGEWIRFSDEGSWEDDYWYFNSILESGMETPELLVSYKLPEVPDSENEADTRPEEINIVVVHECTPVLYDEEGNPYADWDNVVILDESTETVTEPDTGADTGTEQEGE